MLPIRKKIAVSASLVMATAGVVAFVQSAAPATSASPALSRHAKAAVTVSIVPGVIDPGSSLKKASKAKWAVIGKFGANKEGKKAKLQQQVRLLLGHRGQDRDQQEGRRAVRRARRVPQQPRDLPRRRPGAPSAPVSTVDVGDPRSTSSTTSAAPA